MATEELKLRQLQVNVGTGAWRTVMDFKASEQLYVQHRAAQLFEFGCTNSSKGIRLRIMASGKTRPLMFWSESEGWQVWREVLA